MLCDNNQRPGAYASLDSRLSSKPERLFLPFTSRSFLEFLSQNYQNQGGTKKRQTALSIINTRICRLYLFFLLCERNHTFLTSHRLPWNQFSHATLKILQLIHLFFLYHPHLAPRFHGNVLYASQPLFPITKLHCSSSIIITETKSDFLLNVSAR